MAEIRAVEFDKDTAEIAAIDTSFVTARVYEVSASGETISLTPRDLATAITKRFPLEDLDNPDRPYDRGWVAVEDGRFVAFAATAFEPWNRRLTLWHLYVDGPARGRGLARRLLDQAEAHGRTLGARHMWLETSSLNLPGVAAYRALGFSLTGVDLTLYDGTPAEGEAALFFSRPIS
jgi:ribosomal protein S18 acetylase RimI-like enzyme